MPTISIGEVSSASNTLRIGQRVIVRERENIPAIFPAIFPAIGEIVNLPSTEQESDWIADVRITYNMNISRFDTYEGDGLGRSWRVFTRDFYLDLETPIDPIINFVRCDNCGEMRECNETECSCDDDEFVVKEGKPWKATKRSEITQFNCWRLVGVELEYNKAEKYGYLSKFCKDWRAGNHEDSSCGYEVVTAPVAGNYLVECLTDMGEALRAARAQSDDRCGVHVHVDTHDYTWEDMYRLLAIYAKIEPLLYLLAGQHRMINTYSKPCGMAYANALSSNDKKGEVLKVAFGMGTYDCTRNARRRQRIMNNKKDGGRYRGLNICPWLFARKMKRFDNTVEFRIHRDSLDAGGRVLAWAKLCARIVDWCAKSTDKEVSALPKSPIRLLCKIAPDCKDWILGRLKEWRKSCSPDRSSRSKPIRRIAFRNGTCEIRSEIRTRYAGTRELRMTLENHIAALGSSYPVATAGAGP